MKTILFTTGCHEEYEVLGLLEVPDDFDVVNKFLEYKRRLQCKNGVGLSERKISTEVKRLHDFQPIPKIYIIRDVVSLFSWSLQRDRGFEPVDYTEMNLSL